jgi:hypothetical protein
LNTSQQRWRIIYDPYGGTWGAENIYYYQVNMIALWSYDDEESSPYSVERTKINKNMKVASDTNIDAIISALQSYYTDVFSNSQNNHRNDMAYGSTSQTLLSAVNNYVTNNVSNNVETTINNNYYSSSTSTTVINEQGNTTGSEGESGGTFIGGTYSNQRAGNAYEPEYDDFQTLFNDFMTSMKGTSLFSMPSTFTGSIPTSTVCTYEIDCGQFGKHIVDFCSWDTALLILKAIMLLCFSWWSMRIIILKT